MQIKNSQHFQILTIALRWSRQCLRLKGEMKVGKMSAKWGKSEWKVCLCQFTSSHEFRAFSVFDEINSNRAHSGQSSIELCLLPVDEQIRAILRPFPALFILISTVSFFLSMVEFGC